MCVYNDKILRGVNSLRVKRSFAYVESCTPKIHPRYDEIAAFRTVTKICEEENVDEKVKIKVYEGIKKMRSAEGVSVSS